MKRNTLIFLFILFLVSFLGLVKVALADPYNSTVFFYYNPCNSFCFEPPPGVGICSPPPDSCLGVVDEPLLGSEPFTYTDGSVYCATFNGVSGGIMGIDTSQSMITPSNCDVYDSCNSPIYDSGGICRTDGTDDVFVFSGSQNLTKYARRTELGGPGVACGGYTPFYSAFLPKTCCDYDYPTTYGVCPPQSDPDPVFAWVDGNGPQHVGNSVFISNCAGHTEGCDGTDNWQMLVTAGKPNTAVELFYNGISLGGPGYYGNTDSSGSLYIDNTPQPITDGSEANYSYYVKVGNGTSGSILGNIQDYSISASGNLTLQSGQDGSVTVNVTDKANGFNENIDFTVQNCPIGANCGGTVTSNGTSTITITPGVTTPAGTYDLIIRGTYSDHYRESLPGLVILNVFLAVPVTTLQGRSTSPTFSEGPISITSGGPVILRWTATNNPTGCTASAVPANASWNGVKAISGTQTISGVVANTVFSLYCTNAGGNGAPDSFNARILSVALSSSPDVIGPSVSTSPTATVSGTSSGTIRYFFDCDNNGTDELDTTQLIGSNPYTAVNLCSYPTTGTKTIRVTVWHSEGTATATTTVIVRDFVLSVAPVPPATPLTRMVAQGGSTTYPVTCVGINGFVGPVTIDNSTNNPANGWLLTDGITVTPRSINCSAGAGTITDVTVNVSAGTSTGDYIRTISGDGANIGRRSTNPVELQVRTQPNFSLAVTNSPLIVPQGESRSFTITAACFGTFTGPVTNIGVTNGLPDYATFGNPSGATINIPCGGAGSLPVYTQNTPPNITPIGSSILTFTGTGAGVGNRTTTAVLSVTAVDAFNIISFVRNNADPTPTSPFDTSLTVVVDESLVGTTNYTFWWNCNNSSTNVVVVTNNCGNPDGTAGNSIGNKFDGRPIGFNNQTSIVNRYISSSSPITFTAKVIAERGSQAREMRLPITVQPAVQDFRLDVTPTSAQSIDIGGSPANYTITLACLGGYGTGPGNWWPVTLSSGVNNLQSGVMAVFNPVTRRISSCGGAVTAALTAGISATPTGVARLISFSGSSGSSSPIGVVTRNSVPTVSLTVNTPPLNCSVTSPVPPAYGQISPQPNSLITFTATGGDGSYVWVPVTAGGTVVGPSNLTTFQMTYPTSGTKTVQVTSAGNNRRCSVSIYPRPVVSNVRAIMPDYCASGPSATVSWSYTSSYAQTSYRIQVGDRMAVINPETGFAAPVFDSGTITSSGTSYFISGGLNFGQQYKVAVKVINTLGSASVWTAQSLCLDDYEGYGGGKSCDNPNSNFWTTPDHSYPNIDFSWSPFSPAPVAGQDVQFTDASRCYDDSGVQVTCSSWLWQFCDDNFCSSSTSSTDENPIKNWADSGIFNVTDQVTDADGYKCSRSKLTNVEQAIPTWEEVPVK